MKKLPRKLAGLAVLALGLTLGGGCPALGAQNDPPGWFNVTNQELDSMRGGFMTDSGLRISLGVIKAVFIDGMLKTVTSFNVPNLPVNMTNADNSIKNVQSEALPARPATVAAANSNPSVGVVSGDTAPVLVSAQQADVATIIQNTGKMILVQNSADQKVIQNMTIINATMNSASMFRSLNLMYRVNQQMIHMPR
ncbi:MAG: hypothetical protein VB050_04015 [Geobacteraceae bacterium]|nr:hypothetical protein [Geobacteraceae bacterium]